MSHTTRIGDTVFIHNGDYSGDVQIVLETMPGIIMSVPFSDLASLVAGYIRAQRISRIEQAFDGELLMGILLPSLPLKL